MLHDPRHRTDEPRDRRGVALVVAALIAVALMAIGGAYVTNMMDKSEEPSQQTTRAK
jgi:hypothetical protein